MRNLNSRRRGWMIFEVMGALFLVGFLAVLLAMAVQRQEINLQRMSNSRSAMREAENALLALQSGARPGDHVTVTQLPLPSESRGKMWVEVHAEFSGGQATLDGLVPSNAQLTMAPYAAAGANP